MAGSQIVQQIPGINAGMVTIGKPGADRVITHWFDGGDSDLALAGLQAFLPLAVAAHLGGG